MLFLTGDFVDHAERVCRSDQFVAADVVVVRTTIGIKHRNARNATGARQVIDDQQRVDHGDETVIVDIAELIRVLQSAGDDLSINRCDVTESALSISDPVLEGVTSDESRIRHVLDGTVSLRDRCTTIRLHQR